MCNAIAWRILIHTNVQNCLRTSRLEEIGRQRGQSTTRGSAMAYGLVGGVHGTEVINSAPHRVCGGRFMVRFIAMLPLCEMMATPLSTDSEP